MNSNISDTKNKKKSRSISFILTVLIVIIIATILIDRFYNPKVVSAQIAPWYNGYKAAYSIIHDDACLDDCKGIFEYADTMAYNRGVKLGVGAVTGVCSEGGDTLWPKLQQLVKHGHEIIGHSWNHGAAVDLGWVPMDWKYERDVVAVKDTLEKNSGGKVTFFIFPYDAYNDERINELKNAGYLGARAGKKQYEDRGVNRGNMNYNPYRTIFDAYMSEEEQNEIDSSDSPYTTSIYDDSKGDVALQHAKAAVMTHGWSLQEMHTVDNQVPRSWGQISVEDYRQLLDYIVSERDSGNLWIETPTTVAKYIVTKNALEGVKLNGNKLSFVSRPHDERYNSPITLKLTTRNSPDSLFIWQNGKKIPARKVADNSWIVNLDKYDDMVFSYSKNGN